MYNPYKKTGWQKVKEALGITFAVVFALVLGMVVAIPFLVKMEVSFAFIDFLNRH